MANLASPSNPGDAAIYLGSIKLLRETFPGAEIVLATRAYSERQVFEAWNCEVIPGYPDVEVLGRNNVMRKVLSLPRMLAAREPLKSEVKKADAVFLAGGGYLYSYRTWLPGLTFLSHHMPAFWAAASRKPLVFLPQSYGPLLSSAARELLGRALKKANHVYYRDLCSGDWLRQTYGARAGRVAFMPDHAFYITPQDLGAQAPEQSGSLWTAVTVRPWDPVGRPEVFLKKMTQLLVRLHHETGTGFRVVAQVLRPRAAETDEGVSRALALSLESEIGTGHVCLHIPENRFEAAELSRLYGGCQLVIGTRLHSAILGMISGTPAAAIGYQPKAEGVFTALGLKELYLGSLADFSVEYAFSVCRDILQKGEMWRNRIAGALESARNQIRQTFRHDCSGRLL